MNYFKEIIKNITIRKFYLLKLLFNKKQSFFYKTDWIKAFKSKKPIFLGNIYPWFSISFLFYLKNNPEFNNRKFKIFEYGSGYSTIYFAKLGHIVDSVENSVEWFKKAKKGISNFENCNVYYEDINNGKYTSRIEYSPKEYDIVIIDGRERIKCLLHFIKKINNKGIIIFDDTHREKYKAGVDYMIDRGFKELRFWGIGPGSISLKATSLFYRDDNIFNI